MRRHGEVAAEVALETSDRFAEILFPAIEQLLAEAGVAFDQIECFAAAAGPGSFTGVRIGLAAAKGMAHAMGKSAVGVSNLRALASFGTSARRAVILDARRGDVYAAVYDRELKCISAEIVTRLSTWLEGLEVVPSEFIAPAEFRGQLPESTPYVEAPVRLAAAMAACADLDCSNGITTDPAGLDANYVRRSDAELFWLDAR